MIKALLSRAAGVSAAVVVASAASATPFGEVSLPESINKLVPDGAYVLGYTDSLQDMQQAMVGTVSAVEPQMAMMVAMGGPATMLNMMVMKEGGAMGSAGVKADGAAAFFMAPADPETGQPLTGMIFEVEDAEGLVSTQPTMSIVRLPGTNWISLASSPYTLSSAPSALGDGMMSATVSANIDQQLLVQEYRPQIEGFLNMLQQPVPEGMLPPEQEEMLQRSQELNAAKIKKFLDMFKSWDIGIDLNGPELDVLARSVPTDSSKLLKGSSGLAALARLIPSDMAITGVAGIDSVQAMVEMSEMDFQALPPVARAKMESLMPVWMACLGTMKSGFAFGMSFSEKGLEMVSVMDTPDADAALEAVKIGWDALLATDIGVTATPLQIMRGKGVGYSVKLDAKQMLDFIGAAGMMPPAAPGQPDPAVMMQAMFNGFTGPDGMMVRYLVENGHIVTVIGNARLASARTLVADGGSDNHLSEMVSNALAAPTWAAIFEVRQLVGEGLGMARTMMGPMGAMLPPAIPNGAPVQMTLVGSGNGTSWDQVRVRTNLKDWYTMIQEMQQAFQPKPVATVDTNEGH